jgi:hypothetical protein
MLILNGSGGSGKDTFAMLCNKYTPFCVRHCSTVEPIKAAASMLGWNHQKDEKSRKFLSDLKDLCTAAFDTSFNYIKEEYENAQDDDIEYLFVDSREPEEIKRFVEQFGARTIYVDATARIPAITTNHADANVANYNYDYYINNNGTLEDLQAIAKDFMNKLDKEIDNETFD